MVSSVVLIRKEIPEDIPAIRAVNAEAFGRPQEGRLVDALRSNGGIMLSLVAVADGQPVGHILYSPVTITGADDSVAGAGLGPMAVLPGHQKRGIGGQLIERGNEILRGAGCPFVVVLGHPNYYPRFGFRAAHTFGVRCEWDVPDEVFMMMVMDSAKTPDGGGLARYRPEFASIEDD